MVAAYNFSGRSALVVEDVPESRKGYVANLKALGFEVEEADRVEVAKQKLRRRRFDLAWVDLGLEEPDVYTSLAGKEVVRFIRELADPTFVFVVTVVSDANTAIELTKSLGADDYITKDKLTTSTPNEVFARIAAGLKVYERSRKVNVSSVGALLFGSFGEQGFYASLSKLFSPSPVVPANLVHSAVDAVLDRAWPLLPPNGEKNHFVVRDRRFVGEFWSRALGHAVSLELTPVSKEEPSAGAISVFERGKLRISIIRTNRSRDHFKG